MALATLLDNSGFRRPPTHELRRPHRRLRRSQRVRRVSAMGSAGPMVLRRHPPADFIGPGCQDGKHIGDDTKELPQDVVLQATPFGGPWRGAPGPITPLALYNYGPSPDTVSVCSPIDSAVVADKIGGDIGRCVLACVPRPEARFRNEGRAPISQSHARCHGTQRCSPTRRPPTLRHKAFVFSDTGKEGLAARRDHLRMLSKCAPPAVL